MNYEEFKDAVITRFKDYLPEQYREKELTVMQINKVNQVKDAISLQFIRTKDNVIIAPNIYINDMYDSYLENEDLEGVLHKAADIMVVNLIAIQNDDLPDLDFENMKDNIVFQIVNTEQNKEMLSDMPHREFLDLSLIYKFILREEENGLVCARIGKDTAAFLGLSEGDLFKLATENTRRILPPVVNTLTDVVRELYRGMSNENIDEMLSEVPKELEMYVISNERRINGAVSLVYEDVFHNLAMELDKDLYILPSSIHELIAIASNDNDPNELAQMVAEVNEDEVELEKRLSNQVYYYDRNLRKITLATDTPNKRLDGVN